MLHIDANGERTHVCVPGRTELTVAPGVHAAVRLVCAPGHMELAIHVQNDASLLLLVTGEADAETVIMQTQRIGARARLHAVCLTLGPIGKHTLVSTVEGEHGDSTVDWLLQSNGAMQQHVAVRNIFLARGGRGEVTMKAVVQDTARVKLEGMIEIGLHGGGTDTYLTERVLMLDPTAKVDATPGLEIKTNDVKASHSATVEHVRPEDSFYLTSRGIHPKEARLMCVQGFLAELTERIPVAEWREDVMEKLGLL